MNLRKYNYDDDFKLLLLLLEELIRKRSKERGIRIIHNK
jgi:hypothetical protein